MEPPGRLLSMSENDERIFVVSANMPARAETAFMSGSRRAGTGVALSLMVLLVIGMFTLAAFTGRSASVADRNASAQDMDRSVRPGNDFYRYANGGWLARTAIPSGQASYDTRAMLGERNTQRVRELIQ